MTFEFIIMEVTLPFLAGLGLFLFGMKLLSDNLEKAAGTKLRKLLNVMTTNKFLGLTVGALFTAVIQSSSATTVMVVGFVNAGLMNLMQAAGVILGADIGTTITGQLIALDLTAIAPVFLFVGVVMYFFIKNKKISIIGAAIAGFGILFVGLDMMGSGLKELAQFEEVTNLLIMFKNPLLGLFAGALLTTLIQSSSASMGILLAMSMQGLVTLDMSVYLIIGFNIGTCITALLACIGANKAAKRAALIHLMFKIFGAIIFIIVLQFLPIVSWLEAMTSDVTKQLANFHTVFNVIMVLIMLPLIKYIVWISEKLIKGDDLMKEPMQLAFVDEQMLVTPAIVVPQLVKEVERMGELALINIKDSVLAFKTKDQSIIESVYDREALVDYLNHEITRYLVKSNQLDLSEEDISSISAMFHIVNDLERISDHAENINDFAVTSIEKDLKYTDEAFIELDNMIKKVANIVKKAIEIYATNDIEGATNLIPKLEEEIDKLELSYRKRHIKRLKKQKCTARAGTIFIDILSNLERVADHATNIAYTILDDDN